MKMKFLGVFLFVFCTWASAQSIADNAIGLRFGDDDGLDSFGAEVTYQRGLERTGRRLEFNLAFRNGSDYDAFKILGMYQWVKPLDGNFQWYLGAGGGLGNADFDGGSNTSFLIAVGDIGIEYDFDFPLQVFLDLRPEIGFGSGSYGRGLDFDLGLGARYQF